MVLDRRKKRYEEDTILYNEHVKFSREDNIQVTVKDNSLKLSYTKPDERRQEDSSCEREEQTLNQPSAVAVPVEAADPNHLRKKQMGKQSADGECIHKYEIGTNVKQGRIQTRRRRMGRNFIIRNCKQR
jgi:hypothetical protein